MAPIVWAQSLPALIAQSPKTARFDLGLRGDLRALQNKV
jgi:hypothetical protein